MMRAEKQKELVDMKNRIYDNLESYKRSAENVSMQHKHLCDREKSASVVKVKVILRCHKRNGVTECIITDKVINSSSLIDALKFSLRNTAIPSIGNNYGRLFVFPNDRGRGSGKVRELPYEENRHKALKEFCRGGNGCTLLLDLTHTFMNQVERDK
ncbi:unnamed protein product [Litomosoides sigmodontis]|uniref:Uncharacterized protein n=1 Tax=Litomosoides sigmodontis TaxID=42156 RepID=A0A3P6V332_LITSI|nr:unnamed protein product [Litomosoides sigmodontis]